MTALRTSFLALVLLTLCARGALAGQDDQAPRKVGKFTIGKETTYVTRPADRHGYIDYGAALNERLRGKITPDSNAVVLLSQALGPYPESDAMPPAYYKRLGIPEPPRKGTYFVGMSSYIQKHIEVDGTKKVQDVLNDFDSAGEKPWKTGKYPVVAGWLIVNEEPLALVQKATRRSDYFSPLVAMKNDQGAEGLVSAIFPLAQRCRELANHLQTRALWHLGEGRPEEAWQDIMTCHRLGRLVGRGGTLIEGLVGAAIEMMAHHRSVVFLDQARLDARKIKACLKELQALPATPSFAERIDLAERFLVLETVMLVDRHGYKYMEKLLGLWKSGEVEIPREVGERVLAGIDWDPALRKANQWMDRLAAAPRIPDRDQREKQLDLLDKELLGLRTKVEQAAARILKGEQPGPKARGELAGDTLVSLMAPSCRKVQAVADRSRQMRDLLQVAFALAAYQRDHKVYPPRLAALVPDYLPGIPGDVYSGKDLLYRPAEKGFVVYSVGVNRRDDAGLWWDDNPSGDDPRVRLPMSLAK